MFFIFFLSNLFNDFLATYFVIFKITKDLIEKLPTVKLVAVFGAGYNNIDTKMLQSKNIKVSNTPKVLDDTCANQAMLLILATAREFTKGLDFLIN